MENPQCFIKRIEYKSGDKFTDYLLGDIHLGSKHCQLGKFKSVLEEVRLDPNARINFVGDLVDFIFPTKEEHRFDYDEIADQFKGSMSNLPRAIISYLATLLEPVKEKIDVIVCGNHESKITIRALEDYMKCLCHDMDINYCSDYACFVDYRFRRDGGDGFRVPLFIMHGGKMNMANYQFGRFATTHTVFGHTHRLKDEQVYPYVATESGRVEQKIYHTINTGHFSGWPKYARKAAHNPLPCGYYKLIIEPNKRLVNCEKVIV